MVVSDSPRSEQKCRVIMRNHRWGDTSAGFVTQCVGPLSRYGRITHKQELGQRFRGQLFRRAAVRLTLVDDFKENSVR